MKILILFYGLALAAFFAGRASAETLTLVNGTKLEAQEISPEGEWLKVKLEQGEVFVPKADLTPAQIERYFPAAQAEYLTFETRDTGEAVDYTYFYKGRRTGRRTVGKDGFLISAEGSLPDGLYREYYPDNGIEKEKTIINGKQTGVFKVYYPGGRVQSETYFLNDLRHGPSRIFDERGGLISEEKFLFGKREDESAELPLPQFLSDPPPPATRQAPGAKFFISAEVFSVSEADNRWRTEFKGQEEALISGVGAIDGSFRSFPGYGARTGINFGGFASAFSISYSYVLGPSAKTDIDVAAAGGDSKQTITTAYQRAMLEAKVPLFRAGHDSLDLGAGAGQAFGTMRRESSLFGTLPTLLGEPASSKASTIWNGFTYDVTLSATSRGENGGYLEFGVRYSHFPDRPGDAKWSKLVWNPLSGFLKLAF